MLNVEQPAIVVEKIIIAEDILNSFILCAYNKLIRLIKTVYHALNFSESSTCLSQSYISDIENGKKDGSVKVIKVIADMLDADIELVI